MLGVVIDQSADDPAVVYVKIQTSFWELNFAAHLSELDRLRRIRDLVRPGGRALQLGDVAGVPVYWSMSEDNVSALVGHDDITWDIGLVMPFEVIDRLIVEAESFLPDARRSGPDPVQLELF